MFEVENEVAVVAVTRDQGDPFWSAHGTISDKFY
jgi:hypothetical protein